MREDDLDDEIPEDENPRWPTIPFTAMENTSASSSMAIGAHRESLGTHVSFPYPLAAAGDPMGQRRDPANL
ncbi:unnamed protein product [Linum trigynum]|uniref:Uncharacterized protein n=1 Tax=Linum trigynum TaxID=586398 RepID=A0AAV2E025_9ROSI